MGKIEKNKTAKNWFAPHRRVTRSVGVRGVEMGGNNPVRIQSMLTCSTLDTAACIEQIRALEAVGCEIVRLTAPTVRDAKNLGIICEALGSTRPPLVADIHFKPDAAHEAALHVDKIRINPGNYADSKKNAFWEYDDTSYAAELEKIREKFTPLVKLCQEKKIAMRIGANHGSLSDRILNRYGDTPAGMVESAIEFAQIAKTLDYHDFVFSMKASNVKVVIATYRLLAARLDDLGWDYPLHLGVTEAGDGEDGRIKSAIGIGSLLADGMGDTIRVSLAEDSIHEIPVARDLVAVTSELAWNRPPPILPIENFLPSRFDYSRRKSCRVEFPELPNAPAIGCPEPVQIFNELPALIELDPQDDTAIAALNASPIPQAITVRDGVDLPIIGAFRLLAAKCAPCHPIVLKDTLDADTQNSRHDPDAPDDKARLATSVVLGSLLCDGIGDAIFVRKITKNSAAFAANILQAVGARSFKTDYVICPSCGRTLFNLQETAARVKAATAHLPGVKIAVMGCIVNGPGEMADADFGYVGGAPGKINLYIGKTPVEFNIPAEEAVEHLVALIKKEGRWVLRTAEINSPTQ